MDIPRFIEQRKILQVKSARIEGRGGKLDSEGLFSEEILKFQVFLKNIKLQGSNI